MWRNNNEYKINAINLIHTCTVCSEYIEIKQVFNAFFLINIYNLILFVISFKVI